MVWVVPEKDLYLYVEGYFQMGLRVKTGGCPLQELLFKGAAHLGGRGRAMVMVTAVVLPAASSPSPRCAVRPDTSFSPDVI